MKCFTPQMPPFGLFLLLLQFIPLLLQDFLLGDEEYLLLPLLELDFLTSFLCQFDLKIRLDLWLQGVQFQVLFRAGSGGSHWLGVVILEAQVIALLEVSVLHDQAHGCFEIVVDVAHQHLLSQLLTTLAE